MRFTWFANAALLCVVVVSVTACSSEHRYSVAQVTRAFHMQSFDLRRRAAKGGDVLLVPESGAPFFVAIVGSNKRAREYYAESVRVKAEGTFDCLRRNVITVSDGGLNRRERRRLRLALEALQPTTSRVRCTAGS